MERNPYLNGMFYLWIILGFAAAFAFAINVAGPTAVLLAIGGIVDCVAWLACEAIVWESRHADTPAENKA